MKPVPYVAVDCRNTLGEMPVWCAERGALFWIDVVRPGRIFCWRPTTAGVSEVLSIDDLLTGLCLARSGELVVSARREIFRFDPTTGQRTPLFTLPDPAGEFRLNDGACDASGGLWIGSLRNNISADGRALPIRSYDGQLIRVASGHEPLVLHEQLGCPNAICWSPDDRLMYLADSCNGWIYRYDFDAEHARVGQRVPFSKLDQLGVPDGAAVDCEGCIWNARWGAHAVIRIDPQGRLAATVPLPVSQPTACCFGGSDRKTLYVTSARFGLTPEQLAAEPSAGAVFAIELDVAGAPVNRFG